MNLSSSITVVQLGFMSPPPYIFTKSGCMKAFSLSCTFCYAADEHKRLEDTDTIVSLIFFLSCLSVALVGIHELAILLCNLHWST